MYTIEHYDPKDGKHYSGSASTKEGAEQFKQVLEHLGMKDVNMFRETITKTKV